MKLTDRFIHLFIPETLPDDSLFREPLAEFDNTPIADTMISALDGDDIPAQLQANAVVRRGMYEKRLLQVRRRNLNELALWLGAALGTELLELVKLVRIHVDDNPWPQHALAVVFVVASFARYREYRFTQERLRRNNSAILGSLRKLGLDPENKAAFQKVKRFVLALADQKLRQEELAKLDEEAEAIYFGAVSPELLDDGFLDQDEFDDDHDEDDER